MDASVRYDEMKSRVYIPAEDGKFVTSLPCPPGIISATARKALLEIDPKYLDQELIPVLQDVPPLDFEPPEYLRLDSELAKKMSNMPSLGDKPTLGTLLDAARDGFKSFGGQSMRTLQEDALAPHMTAVGAVNDMLDHMSSREGSAFAVEVRQMNSGEAPRYAIIAGDNVGQQIDDVAGFHKDGADWGEHNGALAMCAYGDSYAQITIHELTANAADKLRDEAGTIDSSAITSEQARAVYSDPMSIVPPAVTLTDAQLCVDDALDDLTQSGHVESLDEMMGAKSAEAGIEGDSDHEQVAMEAGER